MSEIHENVDLVWGIKNIFELEGVIDSCESCFKFLNKFIRNRVTLDVSNNTWEIIMFDPKEMIGILDLRWLGYYKIRQGVLQQNLSKYYLLETADVWCNQFNKLVNALKKEKEESKEKYPLLDKHNERKYMTDREILDKYINLDKSCLTDIEKKEVRDMLYEYRETKLAHVPI